MQLQHTGEVSSYTVASDWWLSKSQCVCLQNGELISMNLNTVKSHLSVSLPSSSPSNRFRSTCTWSAASVCCPRLCERLHAVRGRPPPASSRGPSRGIRWEVRPCVPRRITPSHGLNEHLGPASLRRRVVMPAVPLQFRLAETGRLPRKVAGSLVQVSSC